MLNNNRISTLKRILKVFQKENIVIEKTMIFIVVTLMTVSMVLSAESTYLYSLFIDELMTNKDIVFVAVIIAIMLGCYLFKAVVDSACAFAFFRFNEKMRNQVKLCLFKKTLMRCLHETKDIDVGKTQKLIDQDSASVIDFITLHIITFFCHAIYLAVYLLLMCQISVWLTVIVLSVYPLMYIVVRSAGKRFNEIKNKLWDINASNNTFLLEIIGKWKEVKSNCLETSVIHQYQQRMIWEKKTKLRWMLCFSINSMVYAIKNELFQKIIVYFLGGFLILNNRLTVGSLLMYLGYLSSFNLFGDSVMNSITGLVSEQAAFERVVSALNSNDKECNEHLSRNDGIILRLEGVDYSYPGSMHKTFNNMNLDFVENKKYSIKGKSGAGKSTLVNLLEKRMLPTKGRILLNGCDIHSYGEDYYRVFGFVLQDNEFFNLSIAENLKIFNPTISHEELIRACSLVDLHEFITSLPQGYNTVIGERGLKLSGGQRQKMAIARVILHKPKILIFDEATCSIDTVTERNIFEELEKIFKNCLWIVVAQNTGTVIRFDYTIEMDNM